MSVDSNRGKEFASTVATVNVHYCSGLKRQNTHNASGDFRPNSLTSWPWLCGYVGNCVSSGSFPAPKGKINGIL